MTAKPTSGIYYGWFMVTVAFLALMIALGTTVNAFALYVLPVSEAYGLSRANVNTGVILMHSGAAVSGMVIGRLLDRFSIRLIMGISGFLLTASLITLGLSHNVWLSAVVITIPVALAMTGIGTLTAPTLVARWFTVHRGRALAITMMGMSIAKIVTPQIAWLIELLGWRHSLIALGCSVAVVVTLLLPWVRSWPGSDDQETAASRRAPEANSSPEIPFAPAKARAVWSVPKFWLISLSTALAMGADQGVLISLIPIGHDAGFSMTKSATLFSVVGVSAIAGKLTVAWLGDRFDRATMLTCIYAAIAVASAAMAVAQGYILLAASCVVFGLATGATMALYMALLADEFGSESFGTVNGYSTFLIALVSAIAVRYSGEVYDRTGHYDLMFYTFVAAGIVAAVLMAVAGRRAGPPLVANVIQEHPLTE